MKLDKGHLVDEDGVIKDNPKDVGNALESAEVELEMWSRLRDRSMTVTEYSQVLFQGVRATSLLCSISGNQK